MALSLMGRQSAAKKMSVVLLITVYVIGGHGAMHLQRREGGLSAPLRGRARNLMEVSLDKAAHTNVTRGDSGTGLLDALGPEGTEEAFSLDSLGDPWGLVSCIADCDAGSTCSLIPPPACQADTIDNTGPDCDPQAATQLPEWVCQPCKTGDYCPSNSLFTTNDGGMLDALHQMPDPVNTSGICPGGAFCPTPADMRDCPQGFFCPPGSLQPLTCSLPYLVNHNYSTRVTREENMMALLFQTPFLGNHCPLNSSTPAGPCPAGYFCPSPDKIVICPAGFYCPGGNSQPSHCYFAAHCPEGTAVAHAYYFGIIVVGAGLFFHISVAYIIKVIRLNLRKNEERMQTLYYQLFALLSAQLGFEGSVLSLLAPPEERLDIAFTKLSFTLPTGKVILEGATGSFVSSRLVAVMGPSGSGKSTFLNAVAGRAWYGKIGGQISVNGTVADMKHYRANIGFVPQDDIVYGDLTVRENLLYSALLRQPPGTSKYKLRRTVAYVTNALQLAPIQNSIVGSVDKRGISGGQRKRVNIGYELVARPALLFADEPTSGLDATASRDIVYAMSCMAKLGYTLVAVIHQPRFSVFTLFDDLLLLGRGGYTVYLGPTWLAMPYFNMLGWDCPMSENPGDFLLDIVTGSEHNKTDPHLTKKDLPAMWDRHFDEGWMDTALQELTPPPQAVPRSSPPEMSSDNVIEGRLVSLVVMRLAEASRRRAVPSSSDACSSRQAQGRMTPRSTLSLIEVRDLLDIFQLDADNEALERIHLRAALANRRSREPLSIGRFVRFLITDYHEKAAQNDTSTRRTLQRQRTLLSRQVSGLKCSTSPRRLSISANHPASSQKVDASMTGVGLQKTDTSALNHENIASPFAIRHDESWVTAGSYGPLPDEQKGPPEDRESHDNYQQRSPKELEVPCMSESGLPSDRLSCGGTPSTHNIRKLLKATLGLGGLTVRKAGVASWVKPAEQRTGRIAGRAPPGTLQQLLYVTRRASVQWTRHLDEDFYDNLICVFVAYILALLLGGSLDYQAVPVTYLTANLAFALMCASGSLRVFSRHRIVFKREAWAGLRAFPFFLGTLVVDQTHVCVRALTFSVTLFFALPGNEDFGAFFLTIWLISWWTASLGYAISIYFEGTQALMVHLMAILIFGVLIAGVSRPNINEMWTGIRPLYYISGLSFNRWATEALTVVRFEHWPAATHHLALSRLLEIGFCNNEAYGMPSMDTLAAAFADARGLANFSEGLEAARPRLGTPVVETLNCTFRTQVSSESTANCVRMVCGRTLQAAWLVLFGIGVGFCLLAYLGLNQGVRSFSRSAIDGVVAAMETCFMTRMRPLLRAGLGKCRAALLSCIEACAGAGRGPHFLRPSFRISRQDTPMQTTTLPFCSDDTHGCQNPLPFEDEQQERATRLE